MHRQGQSAVRSRHVDGSLQSKFFLAVSEILQQLERHHSTDNVGVAEQLLIRAEDCQSVLRAVLDRVADIASGSQLVEDIELLLSVLSGHRDHIVEWTLRQDLEYPRLAAGTCPVTQLCYTRQGRPPYDIKRNWNLYWSLDLTLTSC